MHQASAQDRNGAKEVLVQLDGDRYPRLETVWADGAYQGALEDWAADVLGLWLQIVHKLQGQSGFVVLAKRWIVERTLAWLQRYRRLRSEYETNTKAVWPGSTPP